MEPDRGDKRPLRMILRLPLVLIALGFIWSTLVSAKSAVMRLPDELVATERIAVEGRQGWRKLQHLRFGDFLADDVQRSITKGSDLEIMAYEGSKRRQTFGFNLSEKGELVWQVVAATNLHRRAVDLGVDIEMRNRSGLNANLVPVSTPDVTWILELTETGERPLAGSLRHDHTKLLVKGINRMQGTPLPLDGTTGYVFELNGSALAAFEVINNGAIWISPKLDPDLRGPVVAAMSTLLLFDSLRPTLVE